MSTTPKAIIIEDDEDLSFIFAEALRAAGFLTFVLRDGRVALNYLSTASPDVIILDLHLPHVDGGQILDYIKQNERLSHSQVVVATADARKGEIAQEKADFVLIKPISFSMLRDLTSRLRTE